MHWFFVLCNVLACCLHYVVATEIKPIKGSDYLLTFNHEDIFENCDSHPDNTLSKAFDTSDLKFEFLDNDAIQIKGTVKYILDLSTEHKIVSEVEVLRKTRGQWVGTMYNMRRVDTCFSFVNPAEIWHPYTKLLASEMATCPPPKDTTFEVNLIAHPIVRGIQDRHADGDYKMEAKIFYGPKPEEFICFEMHFNAERQ